MIPEGFTHQNSAQPGNPELMVVGRVVAAQGMDGALRVLSLSDFQERFTRPGRRWLRSGQNPPHSIDLIKGKVLPGKKGLFVVHISGINSRAAAEDLAGTELLVPTNDRPALNPGEFHLLDLVGLPVHRISESGHPDGPPIGTVTDLIHGGNDLLEVVRNESVACSTTRRSDSLRPTKMRHLLIPFVEAVVPLVNVREGWIGITPPPGLLDL